MKKTAIILIFIAIISKLFGFLREIVLAHYYGASNISDAYLIALAIPNVLFVIIGRSVSTAFIPIYTKIENKNGRIKADAFTSNLTNILLIISTLIVAAGLIFTEEVVQLFASGFTGDTLYLSIKFMRISIFSIYFTALVNIFKPYLEIKRNFKIASLVGFPMSLCIIMSIILSTYGNVMILAYGILLSTVIQFLLLVPTIIKKKFIYSFKLNYKDEHIKSMIYLSLPIILGVAVNDINVIVDKTLASRISSGGISSLNYAQTIDFFVQGTIVLSLTTIMYPLIAKMVSNKDFINLKKVLSETIVGANLLLIPSMIAVMVLSDPIVKFIFGRGAFDDQAIKMTSDALFFYSFGIVGKGFRQILSRPFYAMHDTKTPMINATIGVAINIILNIILSHYLGISGLAFATSISANVISILLFYSLTKRLGSFSIIGNLKSLLKIILASLIMGIIVKFSFSYLLNEFSFNFSFLLTVFIGILVYIFLIYILKIDEVELIKKSLIKKL